jgi:methyltransferase (TIGR00027 family)
MRIHRHSRTAEATAAIRAGHLLYDAPHVFVDPFALDLTSPVWRTVCRYPLLYWPIVRSLFARLRPVHGWILVRDQVTVELLQAFVRCGGDQYILLGAGFDSIALRRPTWLAGVRVIEVDHPATQAVKLARVARLTGGAGTRAFEAVGIDFERETLSDALARSSFARAGEFLRLAGRDLLLERAGDRGHPRPHRRERGAR